MKNLPEDMCDTYRGQLLTRYTQRDGQYMLQVQTPDGIEEVRVEEEDIEEAGEIWGGEDVHFYYDDGVAIYIPEGEYEEEYEILDLPIEDDEDDEDDEENDEDEVV